jgi:chemotaxis protein histidine kinase CheA
MSVDPTMVREFATEVAEHIEASEQILVGASVETPSQADINLLFRSFHSIKGLARVIGFRPLEEIAHEAESLLATVRSGTRALNEGAINLLLQSLDAVKHARTALQEGREFKADERLLEALKAATKGGSATEGGDDSPESAAGHTDLYFDYDTLVALAELFEELLPGIARATLTPDSIPEETLREDMDTLLFAVRKIRLAELAAALEALSIQREPAVFAHFLRLLDVYRTVLTQSCGFLEVLTLLREWLVEAFQQLLRKGQLLEAMDFMAVLLQGHVFFPLLLQLKNSDLSQEELDEFHGLITESILVEMEQGGSPSSVSPILAERLRDRLQRGKRPSPAVLRFLEAQKLDLERFIRVPRLMAERLTRIQQDKDGDFYELVVELPVSKTAFVEFATKCSAELNPLLSEKVVSENVQCVAMLLFTNLRQEQIQSIVGSICPDPDLLVLLKLDGRQTSGYFSVKEQVASTSTPSGGAQVRVPVELLDAMVGRVSQFFSVAARFNAMVYDSEVPEILRELLNHSILHAPPFTPKIERLIRQQSDFSDLEAEAHRLISLIHETTLGLRVIPLETLFSRFPRMVRDLAQKQKKQLRFDARAKGIRVDNSMVELLADPLMHMLRNGVDHGIESPEDRLAAGKSKSAVLHLSAEQRGNRIIVEVSDDGRGIDLEKVRLKAVALELVSEEDSLKLSAEQLARFIFVPGFSTADKITDTSGRGVGMDVALVNINKLGGKIDIHTRPGKGTTFHIDMPLSKAIQPMLLAETGVQTIAFPDRMVVEGTVVAASEVQTVNGQRSILLHNRFLPIFKLVDLLRLPSPRDTSDAQLSIIVCEFDGRRIGVEVHRILRRCDLLIQEMHPRIAHLPGIGGISTLGTDRIVVVVDSVGLFDLAKRHTAFGLRNHSVRVEEGVFSRA